MSETTWDADEFITKAVTIGSLAFVFALTGLMGTCAVTKVQRERYFENECRKAGGFLTGNSELVPNAMGHGTCVTLTQPAIVAPVRLPEYKSR